MKNMFPEIQNILDQRSLTVSGKVLQASHSIITSSYFKSCIGDICNIYSCNTIIPAQIITISNTTITLMPFHSSNKIRIGSEVRKNSTPLYTKIYEPMNGRVINCFGELIDGLPATHDYKNIPIINIEKQTSCIKPEIRNQFLTGDATIDHLFSLGFGQKIGIISQPGFGKTSLLKKIIQNSDADVNVIALIGERGREISEFVNNFDESSRKKSIIIAATSSESALSKHTAALSAISMADTYKSQGKNVLLILDSMTRYAHALRDIGQITKEPTLFRGLSQYVFDSIARFVETAGNSTSGSISLICSLLEDDSSIEDPLNTYMKSILDGHIYLTHSSQYSIQFPFINITHSLSRVMNTIVDKEHFINAQHIKSLIQEIYRHIDLLNIGAYMHGQNHLLDEGLLKFPIIKEILCSNNSYSKMKQNLFNLNKNTHLT